MDNKVVIAWKRKMDQLYVQNVNTNRKTLNKQKLNYSITTVQKYDVAHKYDF